VSKPTLFMFSFGGGNAASYLKLIEALEAEFRCVAFEMPGKGSRIKEPLLRNLHQITEEHYQQMQGQLEGPFAFYGHSMGCYVAHLLMRRLRDEVKPLPYGAVLTSKVAPVHHYDKKRSILTDAEFSEKLRELHGMPEGILNNPELLGIFLPMVRNDFYAIDTFRHRVAEPYPVPLSVMCGTEEQVPDVQLTDWQHESSLPIRFERRPGHHFWIFEELEWLAKHIKTQLKHG
jgi:medium-chain acyl-[acyl-carrier-protein] hydrolase